MSDTVHTPFSTMSDISSDSEGDFDELEQKILIRKKVPNLLGCIGLPFYMMCMYLFIIMFAAFHCALVMQATININSGYIVTVFFGLLGPISVFHWIISTLFAVTGAKALFVKNKDYMSAAHQFRMWTRVTRYYILSLVVTSIQFVYGCYMLVHALSLKNIVFREFERRGTSRDSVRRQMVENVAGFHDALTYSNANTVLVYPLNLLYSTGNHWGYFVPLVMIFPWALIAYGHKAQIMFFNWRFYSSGLQID